MELGGKTLRPYQLDALNRMREEIRQGRRSLILCAATGAGKTLIASAMIKLTVANGKRALFLAPRRELIKQCSNHLWEADVLHGTILAQDEAGWLPEAPVQVASKGTLAARALRTRRMKWPDVDLLVVDECHLSMASEFRAIIHKIQERNPKVVVVGLSATPARKDGKGLGDLYSSIVNVTTYASLIEDKFLVPTKVFAPSAPDMRGVRAKDWDQQAAIKVDNRRLIGDIYEHWNELARGRPTIVYGCTIAHTRHLEQEFASHGVRCARLDENSSVEERDQAIADLKAGDVEMLINVDLFTYGFDEPRVSCIVLVAPSRSLVKYRQRAGRALRPSEGKEDCLLIDHAGAVYMHGFPDDDIEWSLERSKTIEKQREKKLQQRKDVVCPRCGCVYRGEPACPNCGHKSQRKATEIAVQKGLLKRIKKQDVVGLVTNEDKIRYWNTCLAIAANRGQNARVAAGMFTSKYRQAPWQVKGCICPGYGQWDIPVAQLFPNYVRRR